MTSCISLITRRIHRRIISLRRKEKKKRKGTGVTLESGDLN